MPLNFSDPTLAVDLAFRSNLADCREARHCDELWRRAASFLDRFDIFSLATIEGRANNCQRNEEKPLAGIRPGASNDFFEIASTGFGEQTSAGIVVCADREPSPVYATFAGRRDLVMKSRPRSSSKSKPSRRVASNRYSHTKRSVGGGGIHNRRDKRFPMAKTRVVIDEDDHETVDTEESQHRVDLAHPAASAKNAADKSAAWQEAVMLWLSWNSTYEKLAAKMCRSGTDQAKLEALMDEMDTLRAQAICLSEELISTV